MCLQFTLTSPLCLHRDGTYFESDCRVFLNGSLLPRLLSLQICIESGSTDSITVIIH